MPGTLVQAERSFLAVIDVQPAFLKAIWEPEAVLRRSEFLVRTAVALGIPVLATEQNVERMGGTEPRLAALLPSPAIDKMAFSCAGSEAFLRAVEDSGKSQAVLCGIETHICVNQTAHDLLSRGLEVFVCGDAVRASTEDRHRIGLRRLADAGAVVCHSESVVYEWLRSAEHPKFREVLGLVKEFVS